MREWAGKPMCSWSEDIIRRIAIESVIGQCGCLSVGRWFEGRRGRDVGECG
jgi:hypothetical protein